MWTLISLGVGAAYLYSIFATFLPGLFPEQYRMSAVTRPAYGGAQIEARNWNATEAAPDDGLRRALNRWSPARNAA